MEDEADPFFLGIVGLDVVCGHLVAAASVDHPDLAGAQSPGGAGSVHGHVATADDEDPATAEVDVPTELHRAQEPRPAEDALELIAGHAETRRERCAGRDQDDLVAVVVERREVLDRGVHLDLDAQGGDVGDVALDDGGGQPVLGDGQAQEAARLGRGFEDLHGVALARQLPGGRQAGRSRADDRDAMSIRFGHADAGSVVVGVVLVGDEALETPDGDGALEFGPRAVDFAGRVAGTSERADQRCGLEHELEGLLVLAAPDERDVAVSLDAGRAGEGTGGRAGPLDDRLLGHGLREGDVGGVARHQCRR